jgi:adenosylcobinamide-GDP ribazoletransferase
MRGFISALQFLTIIPIGKHGTFDAKRMVPFFPVVGLILGALLAIFDQAVLRLWPAPVAALLDVVFLTIVTGALHIDGLGDTADGLYGNWPREKALAIMKDSRTGVMGLVAIVMGLSIKWGGMMCLDTHRSLLLIIIPSYARGGMIAGIRFLEYGRPEGGTGHALFNEALHPFAFMGLIIPVALSCFSGWRGIWLNFIFVFLTITILFFYKKRIGCITGDMLGAMAEVLEAMLFLLVSVGGFS